MLDKELENIKAGGFIRLLSKMTQQIDDEPTIRTDEGDWLLSIPKSLKKDFADNYWITLKPETAQYINGPSPPTSLMVMTIPNSQKDKSNNTSPTTLSTSQLVHRLVVRTLLQ